MKTKLYYNPDASSREGKRKNPKRRRIKQRRKKQIKRRRINRSRTITPLHWGTVQKPADYKQLLYLL